MSESEKTDKSNSTVPDTAADHVEKQPKKKESPQQEHDNEDQG
jgi:hypothetical protein